MTLEAILEKLIGILGCRKDGKISWELAREWPEGTIELFTSAVLIKPIEDSNRILCRKCDEFLTVRPKIRPGANKTNFVLVCPKGGYCDVGSNERKQWQITARQVAGWVARKLDLPPNPRLDKKTNNFVFGSLMGKKKSGSVELDLEDSGDLIISGHPFPLVSFIDFKNNRINLDIKRIKKMADWSPPKEHKSNTAIQDAGKRWTEDRNKKIKNQYLTLKSIGKKDKECWLIISKENYALMKNDERLTLETIRKIAKY